MTTFFIDLWQDLREKRLWPVAVGLLAATAAVPFVLFKPTSAPPAAPPLPAAAPGPQLPVVSVDSGPTEGSQLKQFSAKNPFVPLSDLSQGGSGAGSSQSPAAHSAASSGSGSSGTSSSSSPLSTVSHAVPSSSGGGTTTSSSTPTQWFRYTVDVKFGAPGSLKTLKNVQNLAMLPNSKNPVVVFMGVTTDGANALFFIDDPSYTAHGKGTCNVSGDACRFVTLTLAKSSETFKSADGQTRYKLELLRVNKQKFTPKSPGGSSSKVSAASHGQLANLDATQLVPEILSLAGAGQAVPTGAAQG